jgi:hypothetical protein
MPSPTELANQAISNGQVLTIRVDELRTHVDSFDLLSLRERVAVLESQVVELKRNKEESEKRYWQFVVLFVGGLLTLAINVTVSFIRK